MTTSNTTTKLITTLTILTALTGIAMATSLSKDTDVSSAEFGPGDSDQQIYQLQMDASGDTVKTDNGVSAGDSLTSFNTDTEWVSPGASSYSDGMPILDESSNSDMLDGSGEIVTDGSNGILTQMPSNLQYNIEQGAFSGYDGNSGAYGEPIYNTGGDDSVDAGSDTRVTQVTVNSLEDNNIDTAALDLGLSNNVVIKSSDADTGKSLSTFSNTPTVNEIDGSGAAGTYQDGDTIIIDVTGNSQYDSGDIVLTGSEPSTGTNYDTSSISGNWETGQYNSNEAVIYDRGGDDSATNPDFILEGGSLNFDTAGTYDSTSGTVKYWNVDGTNSYDATADSVYVDIGTDGVDGGSDGDARIQEFSKTFPSESTVSSGDLDAGVSATSFDSSTYYLDDDDSSSYDKGEAIIKTALELLKT
jgi:hypothetical protein